MNEQECLIAIASGESARDILIEKIPGIEKKWNRLCSQMKKFLFDVNEVFPDANYYTASGGFNLLLGASHSDGHDQRPQQELLALGSSGVVVGDGDW